MTNLTERKRNAILGALVADAAALGLHWLYDQKRVLELAGDEPAFTVTTEADYRGYPGYYAHTAKKPGDLSQYGEQALVMLQTLATCSGQYDKAKYETSFRSVFGYGGRYVGYIDRPTRDTLDRIARAEHSALATARALPFSGSDDDKQRIITKVIANVQKHTGDVLKQELETAVRLTHDDDAIVCYAHTLCEKLTNMSGYHGADDVQLPAIAKLPPLLATYHHSTDLPAAIESAVRVTNNNDFAVACGHVAATMISKAIETGTVKAALQAGCEPKQNTISPLITNAMSRADEDSITVVANIGMSCNLEFGMPGAAHILHTASSFTQAVHTNILAGGDSCGRAILIGAVAGAAYGCNGENGIPHHWNSKLTQLVEVNQLLDSLNL